MNKYCPPWNCVDNPESCRLRQPISIDSVFDPHLTCRLSQTRRQKMGYTITASELKSRLDKGDQLVLLDVREQWEFALAKRNGSTLIPLATLPHSLGKLNPNTEIIAICHHG